MISLSVSRVQYRTFIIEIGLKAGFRLWNIDFSKNFLKCDLKSKLSKKNFQKAAFWSYLNKHIFGLEFKIFCLHLKINMLMSWKATSNNSYRPFNNSRLTVCMNPQRGIWKWPIKMIAHLVVFVFSSLSVIFLVGSIFLSNSKWWMGYKNCCFQIPTKKW